MRISIVALLAVGLCACAKSSGPNEGSQTHFLASCEASCPAPYDCLCGVCTLECEDDNACTDHAARAECVAPTQAGESCESSAPLCDLECSDDDDCAELGAASECTDGRCREPRTSTAGVGGTGGSGGTGGVSGMGTPTGGTGGTQNNDDLGKICDGSTDMRLGYTVEGGFVHESYSFTNPNGHTFLFIDGQCRYYASTSYVQGIATGTLDGTQADNIALGIHWDSMQELAADHDSNSCPDAGVAVLWAPGYSAGCTCGCNPTPVGAQLTEALAYIDGLVQMMAAGTPLDTPISAMAYEREPATGTEKAWPLDRSIAAIPGLIQDINTDGLEAPVLFDDPAEVAALRVLREPPFALQARDQGVAYDLYMRDELPEGVQDKMDALRETSTP